MTIEEKMLEKLIGLELGTESEGVLYYHVMPEDAKQILSIIKEYCVIPVEGELPPIWDGKGEVKSALAYIKELDSYRKVREIKI